MRVWKWSFWARIYLCAELGNTIVLEILRREVGYEHFTFAVMWSLGMLTIFIPAAIFAAGQYARQPRVPVLATALGLPAALLLLIFFAIHYRYGDPPYNVWLSLPLGQWTGTIGLVTASYRGILNRTLGIMWMMESAYQFAFANGVTSHYDKWMGTGGINHWLPAAIVITFMMVLILASLKYKLTEGEEE